MNVMFLFGLLILRIVCIPCIKFCRWLLSWKIHIGVLLLKLAILRLIVFCFSFRLLMTTSNFCMVIAAALLFKIVLFILLFILLLTMSMIIRLLLTFVSPRALRFSPPPSDTALRGYGVPPSDEGVAVRFNAACFYYLTNYQIMINIKKM